MNKNRKNEIAMEIYTKKDSIGGYYFDSRCFFVVVSKTSIEAMRWWDAKYWKVA